MKRTKFFAGAIALTVAMSVGLLSCSNDDDDNNTDTGTTDTDNTAEALESAAFNLLRSVCDLAKYDANGEDDDGDGEWSGIETLPANWQNATYTIDEGAVIGEDGATVYSIPCYDADDALEFFSEMTGTQVSEDDLTDGTYTWSYTGLGTLTFTKDTTTGDSLFATIDFKVPVLKDTLTQLKFVDSETFEAASPANSYKGIPYYGAGDIIKRISDDTFWICVRPAGGPLKKDKSYWVCLNNDDEKKLQKEKTEKITYYAQNEDGETEKVTREYVFAKNLMSLKTAKAAYHTFAIANDTLSTVNNAAYGYENARDIYRDLAEEDREIDLRLLSSWKGCRFAIAYGSYTKDKKRVTSGKNQNAYTQYVQPFIMGKSSVDGTMVKEEMWTIRQDTNTMWSATDNHDHKYANALRIPLQGSKYDFKSFFYNTSEDCKFETHGVVGGFLSLSANTFYYNAYDEDGNKDNTERQVVLFSPELCIKDNKGNTSEAVNPLGNKYEVIYRGADNEHEWNWWNSLTATERYVDGKKTDFASENK